MSTSARREALVRTVRLDETAVADILDRMDRDANETGGIARRAERCDYRIQGCIVHMQQPGAHGSTAFLVPTRNISATGLAFLHGGFVHAETKCLVQLITTNGAWQEALAVVVRCRYVSGTVHEVGLRFNQEIQTSEFTSDID